MTSELGTADHPLRVAIIGSGPGARIKWCVKREATYLCAEI